MTTELQTIPKRSLSEILAILRSADEGLAQLEFSEIQRIVREELPQKVDDYKGIYDRFKAATDFLKERRHEIEAVEDAVRTRFECFKTSMAETMRESGWDTLNGNMNYVRLQKSAPSVDYTREPTEEDLFVFGDLIETKLRWKSSAVKESLEAGSELPFATTKQGSHVRFYVNTKNPKKGKANE